MLYSLFVFLALIFSLLPVFSPNSIPGLASSISLLPEIVISLVILWTVLDLAIGLSQKLPKKHLTLTTINNLCLYLQLAAFLYALQVEYSLIYSFQFSHFSDYMYVDCFTSFLKLLVLLSGLFILRSSIPYVQAHKRHLLEYPLVILLAIFFMLLLVSANHFVAAFAALVGFSLNLYVLILFDTSRSAAREAGVKYYYLSTFSSGLILYGIFLLATISGSGQFDAIDFALSASPMFSAGEDLIFTFSFAFLFTGLLFKLSAFPGHLWAAEVYDGSPDPVTAFFMLPVKVAVLGFLVHFLARAVNPLLYYYQPILAIAAGGSMLWGCLGALFEKKTKRFFAYASINQIGFMLLGVTTGAHEGFRSTLLYLVLYIIMNLPVLIVFLYARRVDRRSFVYLTDFHGLGNHYWKYSWTFALSLFSMAGIPPLAGFFGKYYLILHAQEHALYGLVIIALATSLISAYYYLRLIKLLWFEGYNSVAPSLALPAGVVSLLTFSQISLLAFVLVVGPVLALITTVTTVLFAPSTELVTVINTIVAAKQ
jgi:NADH-quinone oxidoreductase subunit N